MVGGVAINGIAKVGQTLTADVTGITYMPSTTGNVPTFQWYRNGVAITNATGSSYTLTGDDVGAAITVVVSADGVHAAGGVTSTATAKQSPKRMERRLQPMSLWTQVRRRCRGTM
ncbi:hypothetical protein LJK87_29740 [Paenibacillus sp. P25]|nr:hypothetical protein LJK87_29740 [Paenibacillus sp. P25]